MKLGNISLDGGSLMLGLLMLGGAITTLLSNWGNIKHDVVSTVIAIVVFAIIATLFFWQSVRIGNNRQRLRDVPRWMGENSDESSNK